MRTPFSPLQFILFIFVIGFLIAFIQIGLLTIAFDKLGLSQSSAYLLLFGSLFGSGINLPLFKMNAEHPTHNTLPPTFRSMLRLPPMPFTGKTIVAVNVGGCLIPLAFSLYLITHNTLPLWQILLAVGLVATISRLTSRPIQGLGIGMPIFIAPISAALIAIFLSHNQSPPLAYISGTLGVLLGADILRLNDIRKMGVPIASIGGAGTFDGIFITGIVAVLLA